MENKTKDMRLSKMLSVFMLLLFSIMGVSAIQIETDQTQTIDDYKDANLGNSIVYPGGEGLSYTYASKNNNTVIVYEDLNQDMYLLFDIKSFGAENQIKFNVTYTYNNDVTKINRNQTFKYNIKKNENISQIIHKVIPTSSNEIGTIDIDFANTTNSTSDIPIMWTYVREDRGNTIGTAINSLVEKVVTLAEININLWKFALYVIYVLAFGFFFFILIQWSLNLYRSLDKHFPQLFGKKRQNKREYK